MSDYKAKRARELILKKLTEIRDKDLVKKAIEVVREVGQHKEDVRSCCVAESGVFEETFGKSILRIAFNTSGQFHENQYIKIWFNGEIVFDANQTQWLPKDKNEKEKCIPVKEGASEYLVVDSYRAGKWEKLLSAEWIKKYRAILKKKEHRDSEKQKQSEADREFLAEAESIFKDLDMKVK